MYRVCLLIVLIAAILPTATAVAEYSLKVDQVVQDGVVIGGGKIIAGLPVEFRIRWTNGDEFTHGFTNGFAIYTHRNGSYTDNFAPPTASWIGNAIKGWFPGGQWVNAFGVDGAGRDTLGFGGFPLGNVPCPPGATTQVWLIRTDSLVAGDTLGIDSTWYPLNCPWLWSTGMGDIIPEWPGPYNFPVVDCCTFAGDCDFNGQFTVSDLVILGRFIFRPGTTLLCDDAANVDGSTGPGNLNVADITYLISFLFRGGPPPVACE